MAEVEERQGDLIEDGLDDISSGAKKKGPNLVLIISISLLVVVTGIAAYFIFKPKYTVLFSGLDTSDAAAISSYLKKE
ncbi:MAG: hypothetical protein EB127_25050, partial [Alphaproteobacteria bacterium]|nr:hypothetical protein [Alphaproteobacteria bacterium]